VKKQYILIDYENVQVQSLALLKGEQFFVRVFLGPNNTKLPVELVTAMQQLGSRAEYIVLETSGSNALDFHIAYYLGVLAAADPAGYFHIISKDSGFDPLIRHLRSRKISISRSAAIEEVPCCKQPVQPQESKTATACKSDQELLVLMTNELLKYTNNKPGKVQTLLKVIQVRIGKDAPSEKVDAVYNGLVKLGYVKINGEQVSYALPASGA
jgi:hypothetical protein